MLFHWNSVIGYSTFRYSHSLNWIGDQCGNFMFMNATPKYNLFLSFCSQFLATACLKFHTVDVFVVHKDTSCFSLWVCTCIHEHRRHYACMDYQKNGVFSFVQYSKFWKPSNTYSHKRWLSENCAVCVISIWMCHTKCIYSNVCTAQAVWSHNLLIMQHSCDSMAKTTLFTAIFDKQREIDYINRQ